MICKSFFKLEFPVPEPMEVKMLSLDSSQTDLEMVVEDLAQKVNRPYLRTPCHKIISAARLVQQKRQEFLASVARGVAPNDSPDPPRRKYEQTHSQYMVLFFVVFALSSL